MKARLGTAMLATALSAACMGGKALGQTNEFGCDNLTVVSNITQTSAGGTVSLMGNVGVGTATPGAKFDVAGSVVFRRNSGYNGVYWNPDASGGNGDLALYGWALSLWCGGGLRAINYPLMLYGIHSADPRILMYVGTNSMLQVVVSDAGLGIGTNAPAAKLHVAGAGRFDQGITYIPQLGDLSMGSYTNAP